ncbi:MAG: T9SS type A sorting domain-containing protein [Bacteroidetes bacterium]|nr:T9SS type A sorting domain-containing protein [Bacteroidota bacterium]
MKKQIHLFLLLLLGTGIGINAQTWDERPVASYEAEYVQAFNPTEGWDRFKFYGQWNTLMPSVFNAGDISSGALQFQWIEKRVICSKKKYGQRYVFEADIDYLVGSNRAGIVIRIVALVESIQEPDHDPGFNREGIAFYPASDGLSMIVQFSGQDKGEGGGTEFARIEVPKPEGVTSLLGRGTLRIEDFGTSIYLFYNDAPYIRIDLDGLSDDAFTSGTVYDANMLAMGSFAGMEVEAYGHVAIAQRDATLRLYSASIDYNETTEVFNPADTVIFKSPYRDLYADNWVATDALGREMPDYEEIGNVSEKRRTVGIFYVTWHTQGHHSNFPSPFSADVTKILKADPGARLDAHHPLWNYGSYSYHWGESEMGYFLSQDEYVIRKDMAMLANAGVDVLIMDVTNAVRYWDEWEVLFKTMQKMKAEGNKVPKFCFWAFNGPVISVVQDLYDGFYRTERYKDLWFYWNGKPLLLYNDKPAVDANGGGVQNPNPNYDPGAVSNPDHPHYGDPYYTEEFYTDYTQEVKEFFSKRNMWWGYYHWAGERFVGTEGNWSFGYALEDSRVKALEPDELVATHNGINEQAAVCPAQHPSSLVGKSWSRANGEPSLNEYDMPESAYVPWLDQTVDHPEGYGIYFQERWDEAIISDPDFIYINDWNEWTAGKFHDGAVNPFMGRSSNYYFVDQYNAEFNRAIQPMKDGYTDNYYMQMAQNIRRYKGVRPHTIQTGISHISIDSGFSDWNLVTSEFRDAIGDTRHRNHNGYGGLKYTNTTGRNDIMCSKVAYDNDSIYFYVKTVRDLTSHDDPNWMLLFIDVDRTQSTGWEGYDYVINKGSLSATHTTVKQWTGLEWSNEITIPYALSGTEMEISVPRSALSKTGDIPEFYFKWADNPQHLDDITAFSTDGESAPDRRFNYNYSTTAIVTTEQSPYTELNIPGTIELEDFDKGSAGIAYADAVSGNSGGVYRTGESVDIKESADDGYYVTDIFSKEWLEYTVKVNSAGIYTVKLFYSASADDQRISLEMNNRIVSTITLPKTGTENDWSGIETEVRINSGEQIFKIVADSAAGALHIDKVVFTGKELIYPDDGSGLFRTLYSGDIGGRRWFTDSICSGLDSIIDHKWDVDESPGCGTRSTFWNARWEGFIEPHFTEEYTIDLTVGDIGRLWIANELVIDAWKTSDANQTHTVKINLAADDRVPVKIEYANKTGDGTIKLEWESASQLKEVIPQSQLYPASKTTDIHEYESATPQVYPNPARDKVYIEVPESSVVEIYTMMGQLVYSNDHLPERIEIELSDWETGIYLVRIKSCTKIYSQTLIIE